MRGKYTAVVEPRSGILACGGVKEKGETGSKWPFFLLLIFRKIHVVGIRLGVRLVFPAGIQVWVWVRVRVRVVRDL